MTDTTNAGATPAVPAATAGQSAEAPAQQPAATADGDQLGDSGIRALEAERKARKDAERRAADLDRRIAAFEAEKLTESERAAKRAEDAEARATAMAAEVQSLRLRSTVASAAAKLGFSDPEDALALVAGSVAFGEDGTPQGVDKLLADLAKSKPYLLSGRQPAGSFDTGTGAARAPQAGRVYTREQLRDSAFYAANEADIALAQREGRIRN